MVRIPGWAQNLPVPGDTYQYLQKSNQPFTLTLNDQPVAYTMQNGYAVIDREWKKGDAVNLNLPMEIKRVVASNNVKADRNRVALQRGPLVYCIEYADNNGKAMNIILPDNANLTSTYNKALLNGVVTISGEATVIKTLQLYT